MALKYTEIENKKVIGGKVVKGKKRVYRVVKEIEKEVITEKKKK